MSSSRHPIARRLNSWVDGPTKLLATVMGLPLADGIFAAIVLAGGLASLAGIVQVGLLVFGGSATLAVVFSEFDGNRRTGARRVLTVGIPLIALAVLEAALAPTIRSVVALAIFERFAAIVILAVAAKTASARIGEYLPGPGAIVVLGLVASAQPGSFSFALTLEPGLIARAGAAAVVGVAFALAVVGFQPHLTNVMDVDRFRFGSAVALGTLSVSLLRPQYAIAPLAVLVVATVLSFDPDGVRSTEPFVSTDGGQGDERVSPGQADTTTAETAENDAAKDTDETAKRRPPYL
ncbi:MAG: DUF5794 domain-containing protein [Halobacteriaceae archaeon]